MPGATLNAEDAPQLEERILQVASRLFAEKGFPNVSVREICEQAGASLPMVYYYYKNKEGLFRAVARRQLTMDDFLARIEGAIAHAPDTWSQLRAFIHTYLSFFPKERMNPGYFLHHSTSLDSASVSRLAADLQKLRSLARAVIESGVETGAMRQTDARMAGEALVGVLNSFVFRNIHFEEAYDEQGVGDYVFELFRHALEAPGTPPHGSVRIG